jgi:hypothetical protein
LELQNLQKDFGTTEVELPLSIARDQHHALITKLMTGPGDSEGAMHRAERLFGLPYWSQHRLRYRRAGTPAFIERVRQAYLSMLEQSVRRDLECLKTQQAKGSVDADTTDLILEAKDLLARLASRSAA